MYDPYVWINIYGRKKEAIIKLEKENKKTNRKRENDQKHHEEGNTVPCNFFDVLHFLLPPSI